jgi:hypothetical protein
MMARCYNPDFPVYRLYGARGIKVCLRWHDIRLFVADIEALLGPRPPGKTLDRRNNDGSYVWWNVRWATQREQVQNSRRWAA